MCRESADQPPGRGGRCRREQVRRRENVTRDRGEVKVPGPLSALEAGTSATSSSSASGGSAASSKLFELRDLYRIPLWLLAKPATRSPRSPSTFGSRPLWARWITSALPSQAILARHRISTSGQEEPREVRLIARRYLQFRRRVEVARLWPQIRNFAGSGAIEVEGLAHLDDALSKGKGAILVSTHFGYARLIKPILLFPRTSSAVGGAFARSHRPTELSPFLHPPWTLRPDASPSPSDCVQLRPAMEQEVSVSIFRSASICVHTSPPWPGTRRCHPCRRPRRAGSSPRPVAGIDVCFAPGVMSLARDTGPPFCRPL